MFVNLAAEGAALLHQSAAMPDQQLEGAPGNIPNRFAQREAVDSSAVDGEQIGVVGLVAGAG
jgi:hypothetical protein